MKKLTVYTLLVVMLMTFTTACGSEIDKANSSSSESSSSESSSSESSSSEKVLTPTPAKPLSITVTAPTYMNVVLTKEVPTKTIEVKIQPSPSDVKLTCSTTGDISVESTDLNGVSLKVSGRGTLVINATKEGYTTKEHTVVIETEN